MSYSKKTPIYIVTSRTGYIPQLQQSGPIPNPILVPIDVVYNMVVSGIECHEVDPNTRKVVRLNMNNIYDEHKFDEKLPPAPVATPEPPKEPIAPSTISVVNTPITTPDLAVEAMSLTDEMSPVATDVPEEVAVSAEVEVPEVEVVEEISDPVEKKEEAVEKMTPSANQKKSNNKKNSKKK